MKKKIKQERIIKKNRNTLCFTFLQQQRIYKYFEGKKS